MAVGVYAPGVGGLSARLPVGHPSSGVAEVMKLLLAPQAAPAAGATILLDNIGAVERYTELVRDSFRPRPAARAADLVRWAVASAVIDDRRARSWAIPAVEWVRGHQEVSRLTGAALADALGNRRADELAAEHTGPLVEEAVEAQEAVLLVEFAGDMEVEGHVRSTLTELDRHQEFLFQPQHGYLAPIARRTDWELTVWTLHEGNFVWVPGTTLGNASRRRYAVQALPRQLPTQGELWRRRPDIYWNGWCRRCWQTVETQQHVWTCPQAAVAAQRALAVGLNALMAAARGRERGRAETRIRANWAAAISGRGSGRA
ncbi:hypothetical protein HK101_004584 [Irineochytrium annulatum]|nr:hypothetical protein HK101_004584 [Irineochytrium annulatum]